MNTLHYVKEKFASALAISDQSFLSEKEIKKLKKFMNKQQLIENSKSAIYFYSTCQVKETCEITESEEKDCVLLYIEHAS